jgi:enamine deaminase RidA (YjgF/YER057c/UK114 family)
MLHQLPRPGSIRAAQGFRAQAMQDLENIKTAVNSVRGDFEHVVKFTTCLTDLEQNADASARWAPAFSQIKTTLPASTLLQATQLANPRSHRSGSDGGSATEGLGCFRRRTGGHGAGDGPCASRRSLSPSGAIARTIIVATRRPSDRRPGLAGGRFQLT